MSKLTLEHMATVDGGAPHSGAGDVAEVDETFVGGNCESFNARFRDKFVKGEIF